MPGDDNNEGWTETLFGVAITLWWATLVGKAVVGFMIW